MKSVDSSEFSCYSFAGQKIQTYEIGKNANKLESSVFVLKASLVDNIPTASLVWSSKDTFLVEARTANGQGKNLYVFRRAPDNEAELILIKRLASTSAFDVIAAREPGTHLLVYCDELPSGSANKRHVHTIEMKSGQERADLSFGITPDNLDDQRIVLNVRKTLFKCVCVCFFYK